MRKRPPWERCVYYFPCLIGNDSVISTRTGSGMLGNCLALFSFSSAWYMSSVTASPTLTLVTCNVIHDGVILEYDFCGISISSLSYLNIYDFSALDVNFRDEPSHTDSN
jgi:hypothetical protein